MYFDVIFLLKQTLDPYTKYSSCYTTFSDNRTDGTWSNWQMFFYVSCRHFRILIWNFIYTYTYIQGISNPNFRRNDAIFRKLFTFFSNFTPFTSVFCTYWYNNCKFWLEFLASSRLGICVHGPKFSDKNMSYSQNYAMYSYALLLLFLMLVSSIVIE